VWLLYVVTVLYGLGGDVFAAARSAMLKAMLPDEQLAEANGALQSVREGLRLVAPLAGAGIYAAFGGPVVAIVDAVTFLLSAATLVKLPFTEPPAAPREHRFLHEVSAGVAHIARTVMLRQLTVGVGVALLVVGFSETLIFAVTANGLHRPASFIGVLSTCQGVGSVIGGLTVTSLIRRLGELRTTGLGLLVFGAGDAFLLVPRVEVVASFAAVSGLGVVWAVVALTTAYQRRSPLHVQGRVAAAANMLLSVPQTASIAAGAALITLIDYRLEIVVMTIVTVLAAAYLLTRRAHAARPALA
jgi:hypothetical protein